MHFADSIVIFLLALILFGPKKLPEIARQVGKLMVEFRRASNEFKAQIDDELRAMEQQDRQKKYEAEAAQAPALAAPNSDYTTVDDDFSRPERFNGEVTDESSNGSLQQESLSEESENSIEPKILPPSTGEPVSADRPYIPVASPEMLEAAALDPHPVYAEALAAEQNENHSGPGPESAQAIVNHG
jgi:sec-independent protein translocase protein TatB